MRTAIYNVLKPDQEKWNERRNPADWKLEKQDKLVIADNIFNDIWDTTIDLYDGKTWRNEVRQGSISWPWGQLGHIDILRNRLVNVGIRHQGSIYSAIPAISVNRATTGRHRRHRPTRRGSHRTEVAFAMPKEHSSTKRGRMSTRNGCGDLYVFLNPWNEAASMALYSHPIQRTAALLGLLASSVLFPRVALGQRPPLPEPGRGYQILNEGNSLMGQMHTAVEIDGQKVREDHKTVPLISWMAHRWEYPEHYSQGVGAAGIPIDWAWINLMKRERTAPAMPRRASMVIQSAPAQSARSPSICGVQSASFTVGAFGLAALAGHDLLFGQLTDVLGPNFHWPRTDAADGLAADHLEDAAALLAGHDVDPAVFPLHDGGPEVLRGEGDVADDQAWMRLGIA
jgi:hypothetical protein